LVIPAALVCQTWQRFANSFSVNPKFRLPQPPQPGFLCAVFIWRNVIKYWLPVAVWMVLIFTASGDANSGQHSSRILAPLLRWLFPDISPEMTDAVVFTARKCAHITEYAILALLTWRAFRNPQRADARPWSWLVVRHTMIVVILYAATDEFHQLFVPSREGKLLDVLVDTAGGVAGILLLRALYWWRNRGQTHA